MRWRRFDRNDILESLEKGSLFIPVFRKVIHIRLIEYRTMKKTICIDCQ